MRSSQRKHTPDTVGLDKCVPTSLGRIANKARKKKQHRFQNLYGMLTQEFLLDSFRFLNKRAAAGVDRITAYDYNENLYKNVQNLRERLLKRNYRAKLIRRKNIPKGNGKMRPLGIPVIEDKLLQTSVSRILSAIFETDFLPSSYGYRPNIGAKDAVDKLCAKLQFGKFGYVVEADIKSYFDNINHEWLLKMIEQRVDDKPFIHLIRKWLKAGVLEENRRIAKPEKGTPQGGSVSPVLANIYLHYVLDLWFQKVVYKYAKGRIFFVRYADDFVCLFQYKEDAEKFFKVLPKRLAKFDLELAPEKTRIIEFSPFRKKKDSFTFLGFEFRWGTNRKGRHQLNALTDRKRMKVALKEFTTWCRRNRNLGTGRIFKLVNAKLRGHYNYFGIPGNYARLEGFYYQVKRILRRWLNRRSQKRSCSWAKFFKWIEIFKMEKPRIQKKQKLSRQLPLFPCKRRRASLKSPVR